MVQIGEKDTNGANGRANGAKDANGANCCANGAN